MKSIGARKDKPALLEERFLFRELSGVYWLSISRGLGARTSLYILEDLFRAVRNPRLASIEAIRSA